MVCTPLFLNAEPQITGKIFSAMVALRMPALISSLVSAWPSMNFSNSVSSNSETASIICSRYSLAFSTRSAGISTTSNSRAQRLVAPDHGLHLHQVDDALELVFRADGNLNRHRTALQPVHDGVDGVVEIRAHAVHLIDEADARNVVLVGLPPHRFRLRLHAGDGVEHRHRAIQHAQGALHFGREIHVAGRIDDVDLHVAPEAGGGGRRDRDAALLLLLHPVHGGGAFMDFADLVRAARVIQDALGGGGLTGIDMGRDADISHPLERYRSCHKLKATSLPRGDPGTHFPFSALSSAQMSRFSLPPVMREGLVGFRHAVHIVPSS